jgi:rubredoxin
MAKYKCMVCGYVYDEEEGDLSQNVSPGTTWEQVPDDWVCPLCGVNKDQFEKIA